MIDSTMISTYARCPRLYYYKFINQIKKSTVDEGEMTRNFGQCIHKALEIWQKEKSIDKGIEWFKSNYTSLEDENIRTVDNGVTLLNNYIKWEYDNFHDARVMGVEILDRFNIGNIEYTVKIDKVIEMSDNIYVIDYKTSTSKTHYYFLQFDPNFAVSAYCSYVRKKFGKCSGFIPCVMQIGYRLRKYKGEPAGFWCKFDYDIINRNNEQLDDFEATVLQWHRRIYQFNDIGHFPKNEGACRDYKGCGYRELCISCDDEVIKEGMYRKYNAFEYLERGK